jgi:hypothetical protein
MYPIEKRRMLMGARGFMIPIPKFVSDRGVEKGVKGAEMKVSRLSEDERRVHHYIAKTLPKVAKPLEALQVSEELLLPLDMVQVTIEKLEEMKTFLFRTRGQGIDWAYPTSLDDTGHEMRCSTGERFNAA